ncbi:MAG: choice-of-anchor Q domain-containing protein, partial [Phycisphaerae bacterium]
WGGAIDHYSSAGLIVNSVFIGNQTDGEGAAVHSDLATVTATNVTAVQNHAGNRGGGFFNYAGVELRGTNNICWMNRDQFGTGEESQVFNNASNLYVFDHSCITGWTGTGNGVGNHGLAPAFLLEPSPGPDETWNGIGDEFGDVRLSSSSSCRNTGNNNADINASEPDTQPLPAFDIAGKPRIAEGTVDMGAYEFGSEAVPAVGAWAMAVFMLALMAVAQLVFRRRGSLAD